MLLASIEHGSSFMTRPRGSVPGTDDMKLDAIHERVAVYWTCVCCALAESFKVQLASPSNLRRGDCREGDKLDSVDLDLTEANAITATRLDSGTLPQAK